MVVTELLTKIIGYIFNDSEGDLVGPFLNRGDSISHITVNYNNSLGFVFRVFTSAKINLHALISQCFYSKTLLEELDLWTETAQGLVWLHTYGLSWL